MAANALDKIEQANQPDKPAERGVKGIPQASRKPYPKDMIVEGSGGELHGVLPFIGRQTPAQPAS